VYFSSVCMYALKISQIIRAVSEISSSEISKTLFKCPMNTSQKKSTSEIVYDDIETLPHGCIYLRILIISYLATFLATNSLSVLMCCKAVNQSINFSLNHFLLFFRMSPVPDKIVASKQATTAMQQVRHIVVCIYCLFT